jgi:hypothetical protein
MMFANATHFDRKSGVAERRDLRFRGPFVEMFFYRTWQSVVERFAVSVQAETPSIVSQTAWRRFPPDPATVLLFRARRRNP